MQMCNDCNKTINLDDYYRHAANGACIGAAPARRFGRVPSMRCPIRAVPPQKVISYGIHGHRENERRTGI